MLQFLLSNSVAVFLSGPTPLAFQDGAFTESNFVGRFRTHVPPLGRIRQRRVQVDAILLGGSGLSLSCCSSFHALTTLASGPALNMPIASFVCIAFVECLCWKLLFKKYASRTEGGTHSSETSRNCVYLKCFRRRSLPPRCDHSGHFKCVWTTARRSKIDTEVRGVQFFNRLVYRPIQQSHGLMIVSWTPTQRNKFRIGSRCGVSVIWLMARIRFAAVMIPLKNC